MAGPIDVFDPSHENVECQEGYYFDPDVQSCIPVYGSIPGQDGEGYSPEDKIAWAQGGNDRDSAQLLQDQFNEFWNQYMPVAGHMQGRLTGDLPGQVAQQARRDAGLAAKTGRGVAQRGVSRYGADISGTQQQQMSRNLNNAGAAGVAGAGTLGFRDTFSGNLAAQQDFISLGHGTKGAGLSGQLAANANQQNRLASQYGMNMQANNAASAANWNVGMAGASAAGKIAFT